MARPSKIDRLPDEIKELIGKLRRQGRHIMEIKAALKELDIDIPKSNLARHTKELDEMAKELQESLEFSMALQKRVYDDPTMAGATGRMNHQLGQAVMFKFMRALRAKSGAEVDAKELNFVMSALDKLSKVEERTVDLELTIRKEIEAEQKKKLEALKGDVSAGRTVLDLDTLERLFGAAYGAG